MMQHGRPRFGLKVAEVGVILFVNEGDDIAYNNENVPKDFCRSKMEPPYALRVHASGFSLWMQRASFGIRAI